jgi:NADPH2:quinone reductase
LFLNDHSVALLARHPLPAILGIDLAGVVDAVGPDVSALSAGDEVYGMNGGYA